MTIAQRCEVTRRSRSSWSGKALASACVEVAAVVDPFGKNAARAADVTQQFLHPGSELLNPLQVRPGDLQSQRTAHAGSQHVDSPANRHAPGVGDAGKFHRGVEFADQLLLRHPARPLLARFQNDDGFQHRALARDFDVVLVTPQDAKDRLLPAGRLRESLPALRRADAIVLASGASSDSFPLVGKLVWRVRRGIHPQNVPPRPVVFCGIARPQNFVLQLRAASIEPVAEAFYRDHHAYSEKDVRELLDLKQRSEAGGFVTTEKDAVNLGPYLSALEPLTVVPVRMELSDAANALDTMLRRIEERKGRIP